MWLLHDGRSMLSLSRCSCFIVFYAKLLLLLICLCFFFCVHPIPNTRPHKPNAQASKTVDFSYTQMLHIVNKLPKLLFSPMMLVQFCYGYFVTYIALLLLLFLTGSLLTIHKFVDYTCMLLLLLFLTGKTGCHFSYEQPHLFQKSLLSLLTFI